MLKRLLSTSEPRAGPPIAINKVLQDEQKVIDKVYAAASDDRSSRDAADATAGRVAASQAGSHSCITAASQAATRAVKVLANVFKRANQRAGDLATGAGQHPSMGVTCIRSILP